MIKFVMCITRHPDITREEFKDYWMNKHGPFFMSNADAMGAITICAIAHIGYTIE
jgi:hypothetical protein